MTNVNRTLDYKESFVNNKPRQVASKHAIYVAI